MADLVGGSKSRMEQLGKSWQTQGPHVSRTTDRDLSEPFVQENPDGHLEVFAPGNGAFCNRWQEAPNSLIWRSQGWNAKPRPKPNVGLVWLEAALDAPRRRVEAVALADDGDLWHAWQIFQAPFWSDWHSLGRPSVRILAADRLTIGTNQDGRLEVFLSGQVVRFGTSGRPNELLFYRPLKMKTVPKQ